jgi:hypothetical protein
VITSALKGLDQRLSQDDPAAAIRLRQHLKALGPLHNDPGLGLRFCPSWRNAWQPWPRASPFSLWSPRGQPIRQERPPTM